jgi:hypothetical protein
MNSKRGRNAADKGGMDMAARQAIALALNTAMVSKQSRNPSEPGPLGTEAAALDYAVSRTGCRTGDNRASGDGHNGGHH